MLRSIRDISQAYDQGRVHVQRFYKAAGLAGDNFWQDWSYSAGQPATNARVGDSGTLTPMVASGNNAIWFPGIDPSHERRLSELTITTTSGGASQVITDLVLYDLVAVYPLLDGDSIDPQVMDNTATLPRYSNGRGVFPVLVNHVAAQTATGTGEFTYVSCEDVENTVTFGIANAGVNKAASTLSPTALTATGNLYMPLGNNCGGVKSVTSLTFTSAPGGLWAIYLVKPLTLLSNHDGVGVAGSKCSTERPMILNNGGHLPRIYDGAHLGFFYRPSGGARTVSIFGHATFIWG